MMPVIVGPERTLNMIVAYSVILFPVTISLGLFYSYLYTISATVSRGNNTASGSGQNPGGHAITAEWYDSSIMGTVVTGLSESEIMTMLEGGDTGIGDYVVEISVAAEAGNTLNPACSRNDGGEEVTYTVSLVLLDYSIVPDLTIEVLTYPSMPNELILLPDL